VNLRGIEVPVHNHGSAEQPALRIETEPGARIGIVLTEIRFFRLIQTSLCDSLQLQNGKQSWVGLS
jgi:hypothetical protein